MIFRLDNSTNPHARLCVNCEHVVGAFTTHECVFPYPRQEER